MIKVTENHEEEEEESRSIIEDEEMGKIVILSFVEGENGAFGSDIP